MTAQANLESRQARLEHHWPTPLTARELDQQFPGIFDGAMLLAGGANIILQLALPAVGYGVAESRVESGSRYCIIRSNAHAPPSPTWPSP
ncbi:hypothetical protein [Alcanivorax sp.]|uniref:hypothetical protein n=1 Tax=Alcanivorax sp. TaxID=1872427 RepID=UPI0025B81483|nr:hypothetical protein [Alcanivorax sp.]